MAKKVTVAVKMDSHFLGLLLANIHISRLSEKDELQPIDQLALLVCAEARGGLEEQVHASILPAWRPHIEAVGDCRKVE